MQPYFVYLPFTVFYNSNILQLFDPTGFTHMLNLAIRVTITSSRTAYSVYLSRYAFFFSQNPKQSKINFFVDFNYLFLTNLYFSG